MGELFYYRLKDIGTVAKMENNVPYLYFRNTGWEPESILLEYIFLGEGDCESISADEANRLISLMDRGEDISG